MSRLMGAVGAIFCLAAVLAPAESEACAPFDRICQELRRRLAPRVPAVERPVENEIAKGANNAATATKKAVDDTIAFNKKAAKDTYNAYVKAGKDIYDAGRAAARFGERELQGHRYNIDHTRDRLREDKFADAFWHAGIDPAKTAEQNAAHATQESPIINTAAQAAVTFYGGPAGAAAYAAWFTYRATGDADLALKAGLISGLTSAAGGNAAKMPASTVSQVAKKAIVAGALGGVAVAAAGGDDAAVRDAFIKSGGMVIVQAGQDYAEREFVKPTVARADAYCVSVLDHDCSTVIRAGKASLNQARGLTEGKGEQLATDLVDAFSAREYLGNWSDPALKSGGIEENSLYLSESKWIISWNKESFVEKNDVTPSVVVSFDGPQSTLAAALKHFEIDAPQLQLTYDFCPSDEVSGGSFMFSRPERVRLPFEIVVALALDDTPFSTPSVGRSRQITRCGGRVSMSRIVQIYQKISISYKRSFYATSLWAADEPAFKCLGDTNKGEYAYLYSVFDTLIDYSLPERKINTVGDEWNLTKQASFETYKLHYRMKIRDTGRQSKYGSKIRRCTEELIIEKYPGFVEPTTLGRR